MGRHRRSGAMYDRARAGEKCRFASDFAAALLMPEQPFRRVWGETDRGVLLTALRFDVPPEAVRYRLAMLKLG